MSPQLHINKKGIIISNNSHYLNGEPSPNKSFDDLRGLGKRDTGVDDTPVINFPSLFTKREKAILAKQRPHLTKVKEPKKLTLQECILKAKTPQEVLEVMQAFGIKPKTP